MDQETSEEKLFTKARQVARRLQIDSLTALLGSKTLGTNVLELQFVLCWQTMIKTIYLICFRLAQSWFIVVKFD